MFDGKLVGNHWSQELIFLIRTYSVEMAGLGMGLTLSSLTGQSWQIMVLRQGAG